MMARKSKDYEVQPERDYEEMLLPVGMLTKAFEELYGPQRNRPKDSPRWRSTLKTRAKEYGDYKPVLLRPRVVSYRADTQQYYTLDGNGSNHWLQEKFGEYFLVPCRVMYDLTQAQENELFQALQKLKKVTPTEAYRADVEFDVNSTAFVISKVSAEEGFTVRNQVNSPVVISTSAAQYVLLIADEARLHETLQVIRECFPDEDVKRTNTALVKAVALALSNPEFEKERLERALRGSTAESLSAASVRGKGAELIVLSRIREAYNEAA